LGTFFIRCRIKILHQPFLSYLLILLSFLVLSPILSFNNTKKQQGVIDDI
ncbi:MAG TPA: hypothetical protein HPP56_07550, partial [Nitrospirae bacterium]|nr:hypothetical protein [Nitrospirota bacterium]